MTPQEFGAAVTALRIKRGLTPLDLALRMTPPTDANTILGVEAGQNYIRLNQLLALVLALDADMSELPVTSKAAPLQTVTVEVPTAPQPIVPGTEADLEAIRDVLRRARIEPTEWPPRLDGLLAMGEAVGLRVQVSVFNGAPGETYPVALLEYGSPPR